MPPKSPNYKLDDLNRQISFEGVKQFDRFYFKPPIRPRINNFVKRNNQYFITYFYDISILLQLSYFYRMKCSSI